MIVCWFSYCFDMTTKTKVCLQNHPKMFYLIFSCLNPRVNVCIRLENFISRTLVFLALIRWDLNNMRTEWGVFLVSARAALLKGAYLGRRGEKKQENSKARNQLRISAFSFSQGLKYLCELIWEIRRKTPTSRKHDANPCFRRWNEKQSSVPLIPLSKLLIKPLW